MRIEIPVAISDDGRWTIHAASWLEDGDAEEAAIARLRAAICADVTADPAMPIRVEWARVELQRPTLWQRLFGGAR